MKITAFAAGRVPSPGIVRFPGLRRLNFRVVIWISLLSALVAAPPVRAQLPSGPTGTYSVKESWTVTVTGPYAPGVIQRSGVETGVIQMDNGAYTLIDKTGGNVGSFGGQVDYDGTTYTVSSDGVLYGFAPVGRDFDAVVVLNYFVILVPLKSNFGFSAFYRDDTFGGTSAHLSGLHGAGVAIDDNNERYVVHSVSTVGPGPLPTPTPNPNAGRYTVLLNASGPGLPAGTGYGTLVVNAKGRASMAGKLADGEGFTTTGNLVGGAGTNQLVINKSLSYPFAEVRGAKGSLTGTVTFVTETGASDFNGTVEWVKPQQKKGDYPAPIDTDLTVIGSLYSYKTGESVLPGFPVVGSTDTGTLELSDTSGFILSGTGQLSAANKLILTDPQNKLKIAITPSTGVFKGSFVYPAAPGGKAKLTDFAGVLFQDQIIGGGFFIGPNGSGAVSLMQSP